MLTTSLILAFHMLPAIAPASVSTQAPHILVQETPRPRRNGGGQGAGTPGGGGPQGGPQGGPSEAKPADYKDTIKDFKRSDGVVSLFQKEDTTYIQLPKRLLGRDFLWSAEMKETPSGMYSGTTVGRLVIRFEEKGNKILLRTMDYSKRSTADADMAVSLQASNIAPIIEVFPIKARAEDGSPLIDVSRFITSDPPEINIGRALGGSVDSSRSMVEKINVFAENLNIYVTMTARGGGSGAPTGGGRRGGGAFGGPPSRPANTGMVMHSIVLLPEKPMMARLGDSRVGYFSEGFVDYGSNYSGTKEKEYIARYRLEKKDPYATLSEPKKPIVYYVSKEVPAKWRKYIKQGIEDWQGAFEQAGFKNAIIAKDQPDDPNFSPEDVRYSTIRWAPLPIANAVGPHTSDPRSGEIMSAHVIVWHDILKLQQEWYFSQTCGTDPRNAKIPFSDDLMGELIRFVVSHEVGHTLGLPHNGKSSGMIPISKLRDPKWTAENGTCTSIMDYARFNYVAQPGDKAALIPKIGKYDRFAIEWGYKPIDGAFRPEDEKRNLDRIAARQVNDPELRFFDNFDSQDPTTLSESLSNDVVEASRLGTLNLQRGMKLLIPATVRLGEDYSELQRMHQALVSQYLNYHMHVASAIGGVEKIDWHGGRGGDVYRAVPAEYQRRAVQWYLDNDFTAPTWIVPSEIVSKYSSDSGNGVINLFQGIAVRNMLSNSRLQRMLDNEEKNGKQAFTVTEMFRMIRENVWRELGDNRPKVDANRRYVQRLFVNELIGKLGGRTTEVRAYALNELKLAQMALNAAKKRSTDLVTITHCGDLAQMIQIAVDNPIPVEVSSGGTLPFFFNAKESDLVRKLEEYVNSHYVVTPEGIGPARSCTVTEDMAEGK